MHICKRYIITEKSCFTRIMLFSLWNSAKTVVQVFTTIELFFSVSQLTTQYAPTPRIIKNMIKI